MTTTKTATLELVIEREFDAPREMVWRAWTEPEHMRRWMCPDDFQVILAEGDLRAGGWWRSGMRSRHNGTELFMHGEYREVVPPERLVFSHTWEDEEGNPRHWTEVNVHFTDLGGRTLMTFRQAEMKSPETLEAAKQGWSETLANLESYLKEMASGQW